MDKPFITRFDMDYAQALKQIQASKKEAKPPYLLVSFGYDRHYVFPYKEGLAFLATLENAEQLEENYNKPSIIGELSSSIEVRPFTQTEYMSYKISNLLQVSLEEARRLQTNGA